MVDVRTNEQTKERSYKSPFSFCIRIDISAYLITLLTIT